MAKKGKRGYGYVPRYEAICKECESKERIDGDIPGIPRGKVVYTDAELKQLFGGGKPVSPATLRLIHEAKKRAGAEVITEVTK